jgi:hypothetical protein
MDDRLHVLYRRQKERKRLSEPDKRKKAVFLLKRPQRKPKDAPSLQSKIVVKTTLYLAVLLVRGRRSNEVVDRGDDCGGGDDGRSLFSRHRSWGLSSLWLRREIIL